MKSLPKSHIYGFGGRRARDFQVFCGSQKWMTSRYASNIKNSDEAFLLIHDCQLTDRG